MDRLSPYEELIAIVQVQGLTLNRGWKTIAAFDVVSVAIEYANRCKKGKEKLCEYRVLSRPDTASEFVEWRVLT